MPHFRLNVSEKDLLIIREALLIGVEDRSLTEFGTAVEISNLIDRVRAARKQRYRMSMKYRLRRLESAVRELNPGLDI